MAFINPDEVIDGDLQVYFYYWHDRESLSSMWDKGERGEPIDKALWRIWLSAICEIRYDDDIIKRLKNGEIFKLDTERVVYQNLIHYHDKKMENKKICISLCADCEKAVNIHLSRHVKYCPNCSLRRKQSKQQIRRSLEQGRRLCKNKRCRKPLSKKYPNKEYCTDYCGKIVRREKEKLEKIKKQIEEDWENRDVVMG